MKWNSLISLTKDYACLEMITLLVQGCIFYIDYIGFVKKPVLHANLIYVIFIFCCETLILKIHKNIQVRT